VAVLCIRLHFFWHTAVTICADKIGQKFGYVEVAEMMVSSGNENADDLVKSICHDRTAVCSSDRGACFDVHLLQSANILFCSRRSLRVLMRISVVPVILRGERQLTSSVSDNVSGRPRSTESVSGPSLASEKRESRAREGGNKNNMEKKKASKKPERQLNPEEQNLQNSRLLWAGTSHSPLLPA
jgi:hypothetical protein